MASLIKLPTLDYPENAKLDFSPVGNALTELRKANEFNATNRLAYDKLNQEASFNDRRLGIAEGAAASKQEDETRQRIAGIAQTIDSIPADNPARAAAWQKFVSHSPAVAKVFQSYGQDPNDHVMGPKFILSEAQGPQDPGQAEYRRALAEQARAVAKQADVNADATRVRLEQESIDRMNAPQYRLNDRGELTYASFQPGQMRPGGGSMAFEPAQQSGVPGVTLGTGRLNRDERRQRDVQELDPVVRGQERIPSEAEIQRYWTGVYGQKASSGHKYGRDGREISNKEASDSGTRAAIKGALDSAQDNIDDAREVLRGTNMLQRGASYLTDIGVAARVQGPIRIAIRGILHGISGAQINIPEQAEYFDAMLPKVGDSIGRIEFKLNHIENTLKHIQRIQGTATDEDVLRVRNAMRSTLDLKPLSAENAKKRLDERTPTNLKALSNDELLRRLNE